jgi:hypothetical protein
MFIPPNFRDPATGSPHNDPESFYQNRPNDFAGLTEFAKCIGPVGCGGKIWGHLENEEIL